MSTKDDYNIDKQWHEIKKLIGEIQPDIIKFVFKGNKSASVRTRNKLNNLRKLCVSLRDGIIKQRQDNESEY